MPKILIDHYDVFLLCVTREIPYGRVISRLADGRVLGGEWEHTAADFELSWQF